MRLSTRVLDTGRGRPAPDLPVRLDRYDGRTWQPVTEGATGGDGRLDLPPETGTLRLRYGTGQYFAGETSFPEIQVIVQLAEGPDVQLDLHIAPHAYSSARGVP